MTGNSTTSPVPEPPRSGWRHLWIAWVFAYLVPGVGMYCLSEYLREREQQRQLEERAKQHMEFLKSVKPEEMGEATRMLLGIDPIEKNANGGPDNPGVSEHPKAEP